MCMYVRTYVVTDHIITATTYVRTYVVHTLIGMKNVFGDVMYCTVLYLCGVCVYLPKMHIRKYVCTSSKW